MFLLQIFLADKESLQICYLHDNWQKRVREKDRKKVPLKKEKKNLDCIQANWTVDLDSSVLIFPMYLWVWVLMEGKKENSISLIDTFHAVFYTWRKKGKKK